MNNNRALLAPVTVQEVLYACLIQSNYAVQSRGDSNKEKLPETTLNRMFQDLPFKTTVNKSPRMSAG